MEKLSMCRICLVENVGMCVVTDKSLQEMYEKLADVPFVTEDCKPMLACLFCCTRLKQCCQLQRKCVEAEQLLAQMLSEDYKQKPLTNRGHLEFVGGFIITPIENISIEDNCHIASDAIKQEPPAVCEKQDDVELQPAHLSEELDPKNLYNSHPDVEAHHSESESKEEQLVVEIKVEREEHVLYEHLRVRKMKQVELENPDKSYPGVEDIPGHDSESDSEDDVPLKEIKTVAEEGQGVSKRKRRASLTRKAAGAKKSTLKRKLEDTVPAKQTTKVLADSKIIRTTETSNSESVATIKKSVTTTSQSSFSQSSNLIQRTRNHTDENPFTCDICQRSFSKNTILIKHFRTHTGERPYKCDVCQQRFSRRSTLRYHSRMHTGEKPYKCDVCQHSFTQKSNLKKHSLQHTGEKPYKCDVCQRSFSSRGNLKSHSWKHTGEKPYKCDICQRSFSQKSHLKTHGLIHGLPNTGKKYYKCDVCEHIFLSKGDLTVHLRKHSGEKPYLCNICQRSFTYQGHLAAHLKKHSEEKPYRCYICQRCFICQSNLNLHLRQHSGEKLH